MGALGNSPRQHTTLTLEARKSYAFGLKFLHRSSKQPVDITGAMVRLTASNGTQQILDVDAQVLDAELGLVQFNLQAAQLDLTPAEYPFAVTLVSGTGYSTLVLKGSIDLQQKDLRIVLDTADELGIPLPGTSLVFQLYRALQAQDLGSEGNHALVKALEELAGIELGE